MPIHPKAETTKERYAHLPQCFVAGRVGVKAENTDSTVPEVPLYAAGKNWFRLWNKALSMVVVTYQIDRPRPSRLSLAGQLKRSLFQPQAGYK